MVTHQRRLWPGSDFSELPLELASMPQVPELVALGAGGGSDCGEGEEGGAGAGEAGWVPPPPGYYSLWAVFDGHNGSAAALMAAEHVTEIVEELLPYGWVVWVGGGRRVGAWVGAWVWAGGRVLGRAGRAGGRRCSRCQYM